MPQLFTVGILAFLLLGAGYGFIQAAQPGRPIPWDCADWQAFAHADRTTAILESLAENRGQTLYCGVDQSDTFAKAETWAAGRDRNERDGTVYQGENGRFRGFIAAQEGWLTEGESGITGQPVATIFEFPREQRQRRRKKKQYLRDVVPEGELYWSWYYGPERSGASQGQARVAAQAAFNANLPTLAEIVAQVRPARADDRSLYYNSHFTDTYNGLDAFCRSKDYQRATNIQAWLTGPFSNVYNYRTTGTAPNQVHYATARRGVRYGNVDCFRRR